MAFAPVLIAPQAAFAQSYSFNSVAIEGNNRVDPSTILTYAKISRGQTVSAAELNDAYQRLVQSSLFETVEMLPQGRKLVIKVTEFPTIGRISIEGNRRIKDPVLQEVIRSQERRIYSPATAEADAAAITQTYQERGRLAATVTPKIIRRDGNRVDLVFEVIEGRVVEIERLSFVGNQEFSDARLRRVLQTKQAGLLRTLLQSDTYAPDRINFDKQVLTDFYLSRGYVDFRIQDVSSEFSRERNAFFVTFNVSEGQSYNMGEMTVISEFPNVEPDEYEAVMNIRKGQTYSPSAVENVIARMERVATKNGLNFLRVEPRITRQDRSLELDIEFALVRGPRIFVERIDIEGNATTLDRVVRRQFKTVEGDPFNPREIREAAERVRALGFFGVADVQSAEGSSPDQVVIDVNVEEKPTGAFTFGASYAASSGVGLSLNISESNFLGRGQRLEFDATLGTEDASGKFVFSEPAFLGRDLTFTFVARYAESKYSYTAYQTEAISASPSLTFPVSEAGELSLNYKIARNKIFDVAATSSAILLADQARGAEFTSSLGYQYTFDNRRTGLNPNAGMKLQFGQDFAGLGGSVKHIKTTALASAETKILNDQVTLRATLEGGAIHSLGGDSRVYDRFNLGPAQLRGFAPGGIGPRDGTDVLGGNFYAVARLETEFPLGLPEEYGIKGGLFFDAGSLWGLDNNLGTVDDSAHLRSSVGVSIFWTTPIGPLRFNFSRAVKKQSYDKEQRFDVSISTQF
ncbi:MAG: outer membrane protein insertion porin family [Halocynthiibacter sp.]